MKKQRIITRPINEDDLQTPLPPDQNVPLAFPFVVENTMLAGTLSSHVFTALIDGTFRFNVSSQAEIVDNYGILLFRPDPTLQHGGEAFIHFVTAPRNSDGQADQRICSQKDVAIKLRAGEQVQIFDRQLGSQNGARRWPYSDTNRIEISFED